MFGTSTKSCESLKSDNEYLRDEIERRDREQRERDDREWEDRQRRQRERQVEREQALHYANSWSEAFENGIALFAREARLEEKDERENPESEFNTTYFRDELKTIEAAQQLYRREMAAAQERIKQIEVEVREKVAAEIEKEFPKSSLPEALRTDDYGSLVNW